MLEALLGFNDRCVCVVNTPFNMLLEARMVNPSPDWIIARGRSVTNVLSDMMLSLLVAKGGKDTDPENTTQGSVDPA